MKHRRQSGTSRCTKTRRRGRSLRRTAERQTGWAAAGGVRATAHILLCIGGAIILWSRGGASGRSRAAQRRRRRVCRVALRGDLGPVLPPHAVRTVAGRVDEFDGFHGRPGRAGMPVRGAAAHLTVLHGRVNDRSWAGGVSAGAHAAHRGGLPWWRNVPMTDSVTPNAFRAEKGVSRKMTTPSRRTRMSLSWPVTVWVSGLLTDVFRNTE